MSKRGGENRQLRPEEVEALEGKEAQQAGTWQKASADVLKRRRIVKAGTRGPRPGMRPPSPRRLPTGEVSESVSAPYPGPDLGGGGGSSGLGAAEEPAKPSSSVAAAPAAAPAAAASNPFAGFSGLTSSAPTKAPAAAAAPAASNPFAGFTGLTAAAAKPPAAPAATAPSNPFAGFSGLTGGASAAGIEPAAPFSPPAVLPPPMAMPSLGRQLTSPNDGAHDAAAAATEPRIPSQAELLPHWEQHIQKQGTVYRKAALVFAKVCEAAGTLDTVLGGKNETTNTYKPGDLIVNNPGGERYVMKSDNFNSRYDVTHPLETSEAVGEWAKVKGIPSVEALDKEGFKAHRPVGRIWGIAVTASDMAQWFPSGQLMAAWGTPMTVEAEDMLCVPHPAGGEVYRIEKSAFETTYKLDDEE